MTEIFERLQFARRKAGYNDATEAAIAFGWNQITYRSHENGFRGLRPDVARKYATAFKVSIEWLLYGIGEAPSHFQPKVEIPQSTRIPIAPPPQLSNDEIPILGTAVGGDNGRLLFNGDPLGYIGRPSALIGVPGAYAIYMSGTSMLPRFKPGELLWVHPHRPVKKEDDVLVQLHGMNDDEYLEGMVKEFRAWTPTRLIVWQYNPAEEVEIERKSVKAIHFIVGRLSA